MEPTKAISTNIVDKNLDHISFFDKDEDFVLAYKKTEKLASALYMVTNLFSDNESIKWSLRKKVADLLSFTLIYKDTSEMNQNDFVYNVRTKVLELTSLLEVSLRAGLVSQMNFSVLNQEFSNLVNIFNSPETSLKNPFHENIEKTFFNHKMSFIPIKDKISTAEVDNLKRSNRQNTILALLKKKKDLNIKDIAEIIKDCSEKTVQRELNSFISLGIVKRAGVRRWSRYFLV